MYSKTKQLAKNKANNPKKLTRAEKIEFIEFLKSKSGGVCQICNSAPAQDFAHADRAYKRDDRRAVLACRACHKIADQPNYTEIKQSEKINIILKEVAEENYQDFFCNF